MCIKPGAIHAGAGDIAGQNHEEHQNQEEVVRALTLPDKRVAGAPGAASVEGKNLRFGQSWVRAVNVRGFPAPLSTYAGRCPPQTKRLCTNTTFNTPPAQMTVRPEGPPYVRAHGRGAWLTSRSNRHARTSGIAVGAPTACLAVNVRAPGCGCEMWVHTDRCHGRASVALSADSDWSSQSRSTATGAAPACLASICPWSSSSSVGTACTEKRCDIAGALSTSTLTSLSCPARSVASCSSAGLTIRHGPHQVAHRSTSTGTDDFSTTSSKSASPACVIHGSHWWQLAHRGFPAAAAGALLRFPQCGHVRMFVSMTYPSVSPPGPVPNSRRRVRRSPP